MEEIKNGMNEEGQQVFAPETRVHLSKSARWMRIMGVCNYVFAGILVLAALGSLIGGNTAPGMSGMGGSVLIGVLQLVGAALFALFGWYLRSMGKGYREFSLDPRDVRSLEAAFAIQREYWRLRGVVYVVFIFVFVVGGMVACVLGDVLR
jgi:hypothetical protein